MSHSNKKYLYLTAIVLIVIFCIVFWIRPIILSIFEKSAELEAKKKKLVSIELLADSLTEFEDNYYEYEKSLEDMRNILSSESVIDSEIPIEFINFFKEQAEEFNLVLKVVPLENSETDEFWQFLDFRIDGIGRYSNFRRFLQKLEYGYWLNQITSLSIRKESVTGQELVSSEQRVKFNLTIRIYAQTKN